MAWGVICIKSYYGHNFVKIYQNFPKFGNLEKIGNLNFPVLYEIRYLSHVTTYGRVQERKKTKNGVARCHTVYIKYSIFFIVSSFLAWIWPIWLTHVFFQLAIKQNRSHDTFHQLISF